MSGDRAAALEGVGVICHLVHPTMQECADLVTEAERAGAGWCMLPDALGWNDVWMCLGAAAEATSTIVLGPGLTNPYTRHPFVTLAALATLHEAAPGRSLFGVAAGGSELTLSAGIDRSDAPERVRELVDLYRRSAAGKTPIPMAAEVPLVPVVGGARASRMLAAVGDSCDVALVWAQTNELLQEASRTVTARGASVGWAPLRTADGDNLRSALVYAILNSPRDVRRSIGVDDALDAEIRNRLESGGLEDAASAVPERAASAFVVENDVEEAIAIAHTLDTRHVVVLAFDLDDLSSRVAWAKDVAAGLATGMSGGA